MYCVQVNLEYLGRVVFNVDGLLYPDSVVGTDSHTTMINGLGILGWGKNCHVNNTNIRHSHAVKPKGKMNAQREKSF